jgi:hypothetical protein
LPVFKKTGWEAYPRPIEGVYAVLGRKTKGRCEPQSQLLVHTHVFFLKKKKEREKERETPAGLHIGGVIAFSISHL